MKSIYDNILDFHLVSKFICSDDSSSESDRDRMKAAYPNFEFLYGDGGHAASLRRLFNAIDGEYVLHWEDDWEVFDKGPFISILLDILKHDSQVQSAILTPWTHGRDVWETVDKRCTPNGHTYFVPHTGWPGFTLNPSLHEVSSIKATGEYPITRHHEWTFSDLHKKMGFKVAHMPDYCVHHFSDQTAYDDPSCR